MITWTHFLLFALPALLCWSAAAYTAWKKAPADATSPLNALSAGSGKSSLSGNDRTAVWFTGAGILVFFAFIIGLWISLERPPLRTMGETRLWYSFFLPVAGVITFIRWRYKWILTFSTLLATVFVGVNLFKPEIHNKTLMPALQSVWFAPHVIVYMFAYAVLGAAAIVALYLLFVHRKRKVTRREMELCDNLAYVGLSFMTLGMLFGAIWAKEAWGHYWSWDPKETWAAATWLAYLVYIHFRKRDRYAYRTALTILLVSFVLLQMCWFGINYLPAAQGNSVHTYTL